MNAEEILNNKSTYYNLNQEFNLSDTLTNFIKEELEINSSSNELFNVNFYDNLSKLRVDENLQPELGPIDFEASSGFKSSAVKNSAKNAAANPWRLGYSKKRRSSNPNKRNLTTNELIKENLDVDHNCHVTVDHNYHLTVAGEAGKENKELNLSELIDGVENKNIFSDPLISEKNNQMTVDDIFYNLKESSNNLEKNINDHCDNVQNENILSTATVCETRDESNIIASNDVDNNVDTLKFIAGNTVSTSIAEDKNIETAAGYDCNNVDQEFVVQEEIIIDNKPICDMKNENMASSSRPSKENYEQIAVDSPGGSNEKTVIEEEFIIDNDKPVYYAPNQNIILMPVMSKENHEAAVDHVDNSDSETVFEEEFTIEDDEFVFDSKDENLIPTAITLKENNETAVDSASNSDQETVIEEEFTIYSNKPVCDSEEENMAPAEITSEENNENTNLDEEIVIEEEFFINEPICDEDNENEVLTSMTLEENYQITAADNVGSDQEIIIEEEIIISDSIDDVENENVSISTAVGNIYNSDQEAINNEPDDLLDENILPIDLIDDNFTEIFHNIDCLETEKDLKKSMDEVSSENIFAIPKTPEKSIHRSSEKNNSSYISPVKSLNKNLLHNLPPLSLQVLNSDEEYDRLCNEKLQKSSQNVKQRSICTDSEFERMCDTIKNSSMETTRFSFETIELLNEFNGIDQSTNDNLLADLLGSPEIDSNTRKNQDYLITVDPLIDHSTSMGSISDTSDDSDLGIEVKSRHIKKIIKNNAERKKFFKMQKKSQSLQSNSSTVEDEFDKRKRRTKYKENKINYNEDTGDSIDDILPNKKRKLKVKRKRTKKVYSRIEGRRSSRLSKTSTNKENNDSGQGDTVNNVNSQNICKKLPVIRLRRINSLRPQDPNNQDNENLSRTNPEDDVWTLNFDDSIHGNDQDSFENEKILDLNDKKAGVNKKESKNFFSDDEIQKSYDRLTDISMIIPNDHLSDNPVVNGIVDTRDLESLGAKSNDNENISNVDMLKEKNEENISGLEAKQILSPSKKGDSANFEERSCDFQKNVEECSLEKTSFVGRKIKISEKMKEYLNDTRESDVDQNVVSSSTEKCGAKKSPSKLKLHKNSKSQDLPTSSNDKKLTGPESEVSDVNEHYDSDSSNSLSSRMSVKTQDPESTKIKESDQIRKKEIQELISLEVKLEHTVPKQHQLEKRISQIITPELEASFSQYAEPHLGPFNRTEVQILQRNWQRFLEVHNLDPSCLKLMLQKYDEYRSVVASMNDRVKFMQFLARDLPNRFLSQVYRRFRALRLKTKKTKSYCKKKKIDHFLVQDDKLIMSHLDKDETNVEESLKELSKLLDRPESIILERFNTLKNRREIGIDIRGKKMIEWNIPMAEMFIKNLMDVTLSETIEELKYAKIPPYIWFEMEKRLNISNTKLKQFWLCQLHMQLFSSKCIFSNDMKIMIIEYLYVKGISDRREIDWSLVAEHFEDGVTTEYLSRCFSQLLLKTPIPHKDNNLLECIEWMYNEKIPRLVDSKHDMYLPRLSYKNGKLEVIDDDYYNETNERRIKII